MFFFVEHRIENDLLRAGFYDLLEFFRAFRGAAPDRNLRTEIGVFVAEPEPFANAPLGARLVGVHGQIHALREMKCRRIAFRFIEKAAETRRLANEPDDDEPAPIQPSAYLTARRSAFS